MVCPVRAVSEAKLRSPQPFQACSFSYLRPIRHTLREPNDPSQQTQALQQQTPVWLAPVSNVSACRETFTLDRDNATQFLTSLRDLTRTLFVFQDSAVNVLASNPRLTPFDAPIYNGTLAGQIDILHAMDQLIATVNNNTTQEQQPDTEPTLNLFGQVNELYSHLRDAHVTVSVPVTATPMLDTSVVMIAQEVDWGWTDQVSYHVVEKHSDQKEKDTDQDSDAEPSFAIIASYKNQTNTTTKWIQTIDGKDPMQFFVDLANQPMGYFTAFKSLGPRVQMLLYAFLYALPMAQEQNDNTTNTTTTSPYFCRLPSRGVNFGRFFKDQYEITYTDGTCSSWKVYETIPDWVAAQNQTHEWIQQQINQPGMVYTTIQQAIGKETSQFNNAATRPSKIQTNETTEQRKTISAPSTGNLEFKMITDSLGYTFVEEEGEDIAVLKIQSFSSSHVSPYDILYAWGNLTQAATERNVTKLVVDALNNGGGSVVNSYLLVNMLYPDASFFDISNPYDEVLAPAHLFYKKQFRPIFEQLMLDLQTMNSTCSRAQALNQDPSALITKLKKWQNALEGMSLVAVADQIKDNLVLSRALMIGKEIYETVVAREPAEIKCLELYSMLMLVVDIATTFDYFSDDDDFRFVDCVDDVVIENRGGILNNYTCPFYLLTPEASAWFQHHIKKYIHNPFEQYLFVDHGVSGSATNTFQMTASLYERFNRGSVIPLRTVSFGGTGNKADSAVTQYAGGVVFRASMSQFYIPQGNLYLLAQLTDDPEYQRIAKDFSAVVPEPCYYCDAELPRFPGYEIFSLLDGVKSVPLEYVNMPPDYYMKRWFFKTFFDHGSELEEVYRAASAFFESSAATNSSLTTDAKKSHKTSGRFNSAQNGQAEQIRYLR